MTYNGLNILGNHEIISPTLDSLIGQGTRFVNTYNMGGWNGAVSIASRTQMLTGLYLWNVDKIKVPKSFVPLYTFKDEMGCGESLRDERLAPFPRTKYSIQKNRQEYYALITHLDSQIKRLLNKLKTNGMADNTIIIVAADNGL